MCSPVVSTVRAAIQYFGWVLANLVNVDKRIKGIKIGDLEINIVHFTDNITIFLRDITCLNRIKVILRLYEKDKLAQGYFLKKGQAFMG